MAADKENEIPAMPYDATESLIPSGVVGELVTEIVNRENLRVESAKPIPDVID
jgi:hypothetical protein